MPSLEYLNQPQRVASGEEIFQLQTSNLSIHGIRNLHAPNVTSFLGIKYAAIPARFRGAIPVNLEDHNDILRATSYGPRCPQPVDYPREQRNHLYQGVEPSSKIPLDEFECLTLNIYTPSRVLNTNSPDAKLPVLVWIHGGGWTMGDGNSEFDGSYLVQHSLSPTVRKPFIFVSINYRLGFYGFLASKELRAESESYDEQHWNNQGLRDQRLALQWIQRHISSFGGDPGRVTLCGESAGAFCVLAHLKAKMQLFQRAFIMSCPLKATESLENAQSRFDELVLRAGCTAEASADDKLKTLRNMSCDALEDALNKQFVKPIQEPELFGGDGSFNPLTEDLTFPPWIEAIAIGSTRDECALWMHDDSAMDLCDIQELQGVVHQGIQDPEMAQEIIDAYDLLGTNSISVSSAAQRLASDALFNPMPCLVAKNESSTPVSIYSFQQEDIYRESKFRHFSYHSLDNVFLCRLPAVVDPMLGATKDTIATADALNNAVLTLVAGDMPWPPQTSIEQKENGVFIFEGTKSRFEKAEPAKWTRFVTKRNSRGIMFNNIGQQLLGLCRVVG